MNHNTTHNESDINVDCPTSHHASVWYKEPLYYVLAVFLLSILVHFITAALKIDTLAPYYLALMRFVKIIWWGVLLGLLLGGFIETIIPEEYISKLMGGKGFKTILTSAVLGFFMSACSHGILSIAVALFRKGSTTASILTFLLAAPWANPAITILLIVLFKIKALYLIGGALLIAITSGAIFQYLEKRGIIEKGHPVELEEGYSILADIKKRKIKLSQTGAILRQMLLNSWGLAKMTLYWILIGVIIGSIISGYVPANFMHHYFGLGIVGMLLTLGLATIIEICSEGSAPIAFELFRKTGAFGNTFIFLQAGVITDYTEIGIVATNIGKRAALALPLVAIPQVLLLGYILNLIIK